MPNAISFDHTANLRLAYKEIILAIIDENGYRDICDLGGGANPLLSIDDVVSRDLNYSVMDISQSELLKAPEFVNKIPIDLSSKSGLGSYECDLCFSNQLMEHVFDVESFHNNVFSMLRPNGRALHLFPTLYAPPFVMNYILPSAVTETIVRFLQNGIRDVDGHEGKFPAYYKWCRGPSRKQVMRYREIGFEVVSYTGLFGHEGYYERIPFLKALHLKIVKYLVNAKLTWLTSFAYLELLKRAEKVDDKV